MTGDDLFPEMMDLSVTPTGDTCVKLAIPKWGKCVIMVIQWFFFGGFPMFFFVVKNVEPSPVSQCLDLVDFVPSYLPMAALLV